MDCLAFDNPMAKAHLRAKLHVICDNYGTGTHSQRLGARRANGAGPGPPDGSAVLRSTATPGNRAGADAPARSDRAGRSVPQLVVNVRWRQERPAAGAAGDEARYAVGGTATSGLVRLLSPTSIASRASARAQVRRSRLGRPVGCRLVVRLIGTADALARSTPFSHTSSTRASLPSGRAEMPASQDRRPLVRRGRRPDDCRKKSNEEREP